MTAITALTAQNTTGVFGVLETDPKFIAEQIEACVTDIGCDAVKTGMLSSTAIIEVVAAVLSHGKLAPLVVDPVMIAKSGAPLLKPDAVEVLKSKLLPLATVATPNLHEDGALTKGEIKTYAQMKEAARAICELGPRNVVIKGGHLPDVATDLLYDGCEFTEFRGERIDTRDTHGTGYIFASAIAATLKKDERFAKAWLLPRISSPLPSVPACRSGKVMGPPIQWPRCITGRDTINER